MGNLPNKKNEAVRRYAKTGRSWWILNKVDVVWLFAKININPNPRHSCVEKLFLF